MAKLVEKDITQYFAPNNSKVMMCYVAVAAILDFGMKVTMDH